MTCCPSHKDNQPMQNHNMHHMDMAKNTGQSGEMQHEMMMSGEAAAQDFLQRFIIVTILLIPLLVLTKTGLSILGFSDFVLRKYLQFVIATLIFYFSLVFFQHARHEIMAKKFGMMTLVSLAVGAGFIFSAASTFLPALGNMEFYLEISTLIWVLLFGHYLEAKSSSAAGDALSEVAKLLPKKAHLVKGETTEDVDIEILKKDDLVQVKPGEKVPSDGIIISGKANMNEALISGESKPIEKSKNDLVVAGSICLDGSLTIKLTRVGEDSTIGQIKKLIEAAQKTKPSAQKIADKAASILTFSALTVALITILVWSIALAKPLVFALTLAITVLVIACPHALGLAIPTVSTIATTLAVQNGLFIKDLAKLEVVKDVDYVVFDKTGTLTKGEFGLTNLSNLSNLSDHQILELSASLEQHSSHIIGLTLVKKAQEQKIKLLPVEKFTNLAGKGIKGEIKSLSYFVGNKNLMEENNLWNKEAEKSYQKLSEQGKTVIFLASSQKLLAIFALSDTIKEESFSAISSLHQLGVKVAMLTGDSHQVAKAVADDLRIDTYFAQVLPQDKYKYLKNLQDRGSKVMMVGDGVNDAPALTQANVGVAIGAGTDVAVEAGDIVLTRNNPEDIASLIILSRKVYSKMVQNLIWAAGYNIITIPLAAGVLANWNIFLKPEIAAIFMSLSSVIVVINAMTLRHTQLSLRAPMYIGAWQSH